MSRDTKPLILALTGDYFFVPRLEDAARALEYEIEVVETPSAFGAEGVPLSRQIPLTEPLKGPDAAFVRGIVDRRPALILVDVSSEAIPWERWTQILKTSAATRRIPILAFGPHVDTQMLERARAAGADHVVSRGKLQASLPELIQEYAKSVDPEALIVACRGEPSELAAEGIKLLNAGEYYEAHESLEQAWIEASEFEGYLYRSLLQVSVAYLQVERGNYPGAVKMLLRVKQWIEPIPDHCRGVDVSALRRNVEEFSEALHQAGETSLSELDPALLKPITLVE
jgi:predicted metal-dependent hydrolase